MIIFWILGLIGIYCLIKPNNFLLTFLEYGGIVNAKKYIQKNNKTTSLLLWMRIFGLSLLLISIFFIIVL
jgi:hypothetical protein